MKVIDVVAAQALNFISMGTSLTINVAAMANADYMDNGLSRISFIDNAIIAFAQGITTFFISCQRFSLKRT